MNTWSPVSIKTIVVATDLSQTADVAVEQGAELARHWGASLWMLHVFDDSLWASIKGIYDAERWSGNESLSPAKRGPDARRLKSPAS